MSTKWLTGNIETDYSKLTEFVGKRNLTNPERNCLIADFCRRYYSWGLKWIVVDFYMGLHWSIPALIIGTGIGLYSFINYNQFDLPAWISMAVVEALLLGPTIFRICCYGYSIVSLSLAVAFRSTGIFYSQLLDIVDLADEAVYSQSSILYLLMLFAGVLALFLVPTLMFGKFG